jgi:hypothetical protein
MSIVLQNDWNAKTESVLNNIRVNCIILNKLHKQRYFELTSSLKYYRLPVIILNGINSIFAVGLQPYIPQGTISLTNSLIALTCGIIGSIELYFGIQKRLENDMISQRDYYLLSIDIFKTLSLSPEHRPVPSKDFLEKSYNTYTKLIESSATLAKVRGDQLIPIELPTCEEEIEVLTPQNNGTFWNTAVTAPHSELRSAE